MRALLALTFVIVAPVSTQSTTSSSVSVAAEDFFTTVESLALGQDTIDFVSTESKGARRSKAMFQVALACFHNFWFELALELFVEAQAVGPNGGEPYAMAWWGEAMALRHPLWTDDSSDDARANFALDHLYKLPSSRLSDMEWAVINATRAYFAAGVPLRLQAHAFAAGMQRVLNTYGAHVVDIQALTALAMLSNASLEHAEEEREAGHPTLALSDGAVARALLTASLDACLPRGCRHPGLLHYTIHAYDFPGLPYDQYARAAAESLGSAAADAQHSLHMPSHLFYRFGYVVQGMQANLDSTRAQERFCELPGVLERLYAGQRNFCLRDALHSYDWAHYGLLQLGRIDEAETMVRKATSMLEGASGADFGREHDHTYVERMRARHVLETHRYCDDHFVLATVACDVAPNGSLIVSANLRQPVGAALPKNETTDPERMGRGSEWLATAFAAYGLTEFALAPRRALIAEAAQALIALHAAAVDSNAELAALLDTYLASVQAYASLLAVSPPAAIDQGLFARMVQYMTPATLPLGVGAALAGDIVLLTPLGNASLALALFDSVLARFPNHTNSLWGRARALRNLTDAPCAADVTAIYRTIVALSPSTLTLPAFWAGHVYLSHDQCELIMPVARGKSGFAGSRAAWTAVAVVGVLVVGAVWWWRRSSTGGHHLDQMYRAQDMAALEEDREAFVLAPVHKND